MKDCKGHDCTTVDGEHSVACRYEYALARLGLTDTPQMRVLFWDANDALEWKEETDSYVVPDPVSQATCTDERPCVNCFSGQGECEVGPFGGQELLEQARALCQAIERLPAGEHQTNLISKVADATFALQNLQSTGDYFWPRPVAPALAAQDVLAERRRQVEVEGRTPEHDDQYAGGQLAFAAIAYLMVGVNPNGAAQWWPWDAKTFKPSPDTRRNLIKAGALLLADIEWLDRRSALAQLVQIAQQDVAEGRTYTVEEAKQRMAEHRAAAPDDMTQFLEQTDFDAAEKVASDTVANQQALLPGEDDCEGCKI